jgi:hypothetical protein
MVYAYYNAHNGYMQDKKCLMKFDIHRRKILVYTLMQNIMANADKGDCFVLLHERSNEYSFHRRPPYFISASLWEERG